MNTTHFKVELRTDKKNSDGSYTLRLYANINGVKKYYSLHKYISNPKHWNPKKQEVSANCDNWSQINNTIRDYLTKANKFALSANLEGRRINISDFDNMLRHSSIDRNDIMKFMNDYIFKFGNRYKKATIKSYNSQLNKLKEFKEGLTFDDLSSVFWTSYQSFLIQKGNSQNTIEKSFRTLKVFIHIAMDQGIIKSNPLQKIKVKRVPGKMINLSMEELNKLEKLRNKNISNYQSNVLKYFLFACYTGLRYQDIYELKGKHIVEGNRIEKEMQKNGRPVTIPLSKRAVELLPVDYKANESIFRVYSNQPTNRELKALAKMAKIEKNISFHVARHTFATITLGLSNDIAAVQKLCGHSKIQTTQIYAKVLEDQITSAIEKWNKI